MDVFLCNVGHVQSPCHHSGLQRIQHIMLEITRDYTMLVVQEDSQRPRTTIIINCVHTIMNQIDTTLPYH